MLRLAQPSAGQRPPLTSGAGDGNGSRRPRWSDGWEPRALLAAAGALYFAAAELAPFDRADAWVDDRFFWEPIAAALVALLLVLVVAGEDDIWEPIEAYLAHRTPDFTRSLCPDCFERLAS